MMKAVLGSVAALGFAAAATLGHVAPAAAEANLAAAQAMIDAHKVLPVFDAPGPKFDARSCMQGKRILTLPVSSANPFTKNIAVGMVAAGKDVGFEIVEWENQAQPSQWVQGINFAINEKFDLIDLLGGVDPRAIAPQIKAARDAGIIVKTSHFYDLTQAPADRRYALSPGSGPQCGAISSIQRLLAR